MSSEILVIPAFGQGHLLPCIELCIHLSSLNFKQTLIIFSKLSSSIPSTFRTHPLIQLLEIPSSPQTGSDFSNRMRQDQSQVVQTLETLITARTHDSKPVCAIVDVLLVMKWTAGILKKYDVPIVGFFTQGACATALEYGTWKNRFNDLKPGEVRPVPGLPQEMGLTDLDLKRRPGPGGPHGRGNPGGSRKVGPPSPGEMPMWFEDTKDSVALMINTCDDLERPFLQYLVSELAKPVWGIGPLLPEKYWNSVGSVLRDGNIRSNRQTNISEEEVIQWLDSKPHNSVLFISFGSELSPIIEELQHLATALEEWKGSFIWVIQPGSGRPGPPSGPKTEEGFYPHGLAEKAGERGLIIQGWAPQLLILSHQSTGGFLSHCGWNSTVEALGLGVPILGWPIRGDQYYNAKLVGSCLKVGHVIGDDMAVTVTKREIGEGIERVMGDEEVKKRSAAIRSRFEHGFPATSLAALDDFKGFMDKIVARN